MPCIPVAAARGNVLMGYKMDNNGIYASGGAAGKDASPSFYTPGRYGRAPGDCRMRGETTLYAALSAGPVASISNLRGFCQTFSAGIFKQEINCMT
jgi:hypothetical protein